MSEPTKAATPQSMQVTIDKCVLASVKADMVKGTVRLTFEARLDEHMLAVKRNLTIMALDETPLTLHITEDQYRLTFESGISVFGMTPEREASR